MRIIALETSAKAASVAVVNGDELEAYAYQNTGLTHSRTLMPMVRDALKNAGLTLKDIDLVAAANGPGSFTGVRIGTSAAKGIAWAAEKSCVGVSTLEAMARGVMHLGISICCVMDARRNELYNAIFESDARTLKRRCADRAISVDQLAEELASSDTAVLLVGDGAKVSYDRLKQSCPLLVQAPPHLIHQSAYGVAKAAKAALQSERPAGLSSLDPVYIRVSQAERERLERENRKELK